MKLSGRLSLGYPRGGNSSREVVSIELKDATSGCLFAEVQIEYVEWARALSCLAFRPCEIQFYEKAPLGKVHEHKTETIRIRRDIASLYGERDREKRRRAVRRYLKPFEVDGWRANIEDTENHHCRVPDADDRHHFVPDRARMVSYAVGFHRYVDPPAEGQQPKGEE